MLGTQSSEKVAPNTYRPKFYKRPSPGKFGTEKTTRLQRVVDFGPSPHKYDIMTGLSMCSSTEKMQTVKVGDKQQSGAQLEKTGQSFYLAPKIKGGVIGTTPRDFEL